MRQYGEIEGPYVLQMDACKCLANGVDRFNEYMGREAIRVIFRGRDDEDPKARCAGRPRRGGRGHLGNLGRGHRKTAKGRPHPAAVLSLFFPAVPKRDCFDSAYVFARALEIPLESCDRGM